MFPAAVAAGPVYRLLGRRTGTTEFPPMETAPLMAISRLPALGREAGAELAHVSHLAARYRTRRRGHVVRSAARSPDAAQDRERMLALGPKDADMRLRLPPIPRPRRNQLRRIESQCHPNLPDPLMLKNGLRVTSPEMVRPTAAGDRGRFRARNPRSRAANLPTVQWKLSHGSGAMRKRR